MRSSTWSSTGLISTGGSIRPVGRITCSANTPPVSFISHGPGVAETNDRLRAHRVPFVEAQRPVVDAARQAEAIFGERDLAAVVAARHRPDLRHRLVAFVDEQQRIVGQIFEQGRRRLARQAAGEEAAVILDAGADCRSRRSSRGRNWCAARAAAPRAAGLRRPAPSAARRARGGSPPSPASASARASHSANWRRP